MARHSLLVLSLAASLAAASPVIQLEQAGGPWAQRRQTSVCAGNNATTRTQWCDFDINSDYYEGDYPVTGVTREYWLELRDDIVVSPDGIERYAQTINGTVPGPTIEANWGDNVVVHLTNSLTTSTNGTSFHFHGLHQKGTVMSDGVVSITQCPTQPGDTFTYNWTATQYGSSWYHSHFSLQAWQGVFGGIIINGPASANYDEDVGMVVLSDWSHSTVDELWPQAQTGGPPTLENGLINGLNVWIDGDTTTGSRWETTFEEGKSYRMRFVNTAIDTHYKFGIDNHTMTVIAADFIPIEPYEATMVNIAMGQRFDVIVTADQAAVASDFWLRAIPQSACSDIEMADNIRGIIHYGDSTGTPTTTGYTYTDACVDEPMSSMVPIITKSVDSATYEELRVASVGIKSGTSNIFRWYLNSTTLEVDWSDPTLLQLANNVTTFDTSDAVVELPVADVWAYVIIQTSLGVAHPIHLHGFDYSVLAQGTGNYEAGVTELSVDTPMRRDTAILPASGHLVLAFKTDNPGAWLMHCHIGWHTTEGFAMQFIVRRDDIASANLADYDVLEPVCSAWSNHISENSIELEDSGI